ncbi:MULTISPECIES: hypothetical protein [unclassified Mesorhizobium]|uniref:hypothetical protein n=1 Tax=unclassified Mesorhizobium TaxID=325217 RepID=UPI003338BE91
MTDMDTFPEDDRRWFMHIGYLAQNWAAVETTLDGIVRQIHTQYGGVRGELEPPQAFNRKRTYIRKAFAAHPALVGFSEGMEGLLDTATRLAEIRHWALHSGWAESDAATTMLRRYSRAEPLKLEERQFSIDDIYAAAVECASLMLTLSLFGRRAFGLMTQEQIEEFISKFAGQVGTPLPSDDPAS